MTTVVQKRQRDRALKHLFVCKTKTQINAQLTVKQEGVKETKLVLKSNTNSSSLTHRLTEKLSQRINHMTHLTAMITSEKERERRSTI